MVFTMVFKSLFYSNKLFCMGTTRMSCTRVLETITPPIDKRREDLKA